MMIPALHVPDGACEVASVLQFNSAAKRPGEATPASLASTAQSDIAAAACRLVSGKLAAGQVALCVNTLLQGERASQLFEIVVYVCGDCGVDPRKMSHAVGGNAPTRRH